MRETTAGYIAGDSYAEFYSAETKWINKIKKWAEERPDEVQIQVINKDGSILAHMPINYFKISPKAKQNITDEERLIRSERMRSSKQKQMELPDNKNN